MTQSRVVVIPVSARGTGFGDNGYRRPGMTIYGASTRAVAYFSGGFLVSRPRRATCSRSAVSR